MYFSEQSISQAGMKENKNKEEYLVLHFRKNYFHFNEIFQFLFHSFSPSPSLVNK